VGVGFEDDLVFIRGHGLFAEGGEEDLFMGGHPAFGLGVEILVGGIFIAEREGNAADGDVEALEVELFSILEGLRLFGAQGDFLVEHAGVEPRDLGGGVAAPGDSTPVGLVDGEDERASADQGDEHTQDQGDGIGEFLRLYAGGAGRHGLGEKRRQGDDAGEHAQAHEDALGVLRAEILHHHHGEEQRAADGPDGIGGIEAADHFAGILAAAGECRQADGEAGAPEERSGEDGPEALGEIDLKGKPDLCGIAQINGPEGERVGDGIGGPGDRAGQQELTPAERGLGFFDGAGDEGADARADAQAQQEDGQDVGEGVDRGAEHEGELAGPDDFRAQPGQAGETHANVDGPGAGGDFGFAGGDVVGRLILGGEGKQDGQECDGGVYARGTEDDGAHVKVAEQIPTGQEAAADGAQGVAAVEEAEPGDAAGGGFHIAGDGGEGRAHEDGRRKEADARHDGAEGDGVSAGGGQVRVEVPHGGDEPDFQDADDADGKLQHAVDQQGVGLAGEDIWGEGGCRCTCRP
jgi:hypothetical protein